MKQLAAGLGIVLRHVVENREASIEISLERTKAVDVAADDHAQKEQISSRAGEHAHALPWPAKRAPAEQQQDSERRAQRQSQRKFGIRAKDVGRNQTNEQSARSAA